MWRTTSAATGRCQLGDNFFNGLFALAAVLWWGGISFGGVLAFLFADLIVLPIVLICAASPTRCAE